MVVASGGTFAPGAAGIAGGSTTVSGTLTLDSGSNYLVAVDPTSASYANVSGTASLAGTAIAAFDTGSYAVKQYTVLTSAGLGGTTFDSFATTDLPSGFAASLEYTSTDVLLDLTAALGAGDSLNANQQNVASGLNVYFNNGGTMPSNFLTIFGLNGGNLATALSQLSGEVATAGTNGSFQLMDQFLGLMSGASSGGASSGGSLSFAPGRPASIPAEALAYAETPDANEPAVGGWSYWGSAFGGWNRMDGDSSSGANTARASSYGLAMGADFHYGADTVMGFALAYGRTEWELSNSLGGGDSDALQFGVHGKTNFGPAYLSAAAGLANHWMTTDRYAVGDHLKADFRAQVYSGRLEAGYRLEPSPSVGLTPYAALQLQHFRSPSHTEEDLGGGGFALSYDAMNVTDTRTELGARVDHTVRLDGKLLKLGAGLAWAHDHSANSSVTASFASLPGSSFSVRGVSRPENAALLTGSAEVKLASGWTLAAHVDSEQGSGYRSYAGRGTLTYAW
ncbi:MAG: autotransporter domain-containing protein [Rhizobiales bacterium]|nr:autotransporter domain-containing protein [Hyphomicrobiales bacterium]